MALNQGSSSSGAGPEPEPRPDIFKVGDKVCITVSAEDLNKLQEQHGGFSTSMQNCRGKVGEIKDFSENGDICVEFDGMKFRLFPGILSKVYEFKNGDIVRIIDDEEKVKNLQDDHGGYIKEMKNYLGKVGQVIKIDSDGDLHVKFGRMKIMFNPMCCLPAPGEEVYEGSDEDDSDSNSDLDLDPGNILISALRNTLMMMISGLAEEDIFQSVPIPPLFSAIAREDINMVRQVLNVSQETVNTSHQGMTPLYIASHQGHREIVLELLNKGADVNKGDDDGNTPLMASISGKEPEIGKLLIQRGADVKIVSNNGRTALHFAALADYSNLVETIISKDCDVNLQDSDGDTALHDAISKGSKDSVAALCRASNLNPGLVNKKGLNALQFACLNDHTFAVDEILDRYKSLVNVKTHDGLTALHIAAINNHTDCAKLLIEKGNADINIKSHDRQTPLVSAALKGCLECVQLLVDKNADVNAVDRLKLSPLHACCFGTTSIGARHQVFAAMMGLSVGSDTENRIKVARCLIENGARTDTKNMLGKTPLECCDDENMKRSLSEIITERQRGRSSESSGSGDLEQQLKRKGSPSGGFSKSRKRE